MILNGTNVALSIYAEIKQQIDSLQSRPTLWVILIGDTAESKKYVAQKKKWAEKVGMHFELFTFEATMSQEKLVEYIQKLNNNPEISGFMVQTPLPKHIDTQQVMQTIIPSKDVDGFHPENQWKVLIGDNSGLTACTPAGIMKLLEVSHIHLPWKKVVVLGKSNIVGKPLTMLLVNAWATVTSCNSKTPDITVFTRDADIVISATGVPGILSHTDIWKNTIVIDVGFTIKDDKILWDADFENIDAQGNLITPVPWGVWPMTVAMLLSNTLIAYKRHLWIQ